MFSNIFLLLFTVALAITGSYCFFKKKFLYFTVPCMLFLPNYYGFELSGEFPLITATRLILCCFFVYAFINKKKEIGFRDIDVKKIHKEFLFLFGYFALRIVSNLHYITTLGQASKTIFMIVFEQLFLLISIFLIAPTKDEITNLIKIVVGVATVLFVVGIMESIFFIRPFDALYTVSRQMINMHYIRLGLLRATTTMIAPAVYGNMCILMLPLIFWLYENTRSMKYLIIAGLDVLAIVHSGARSDYLFFVIIIIMYVVFFLKEKKRRIMFVKNATLIAAILLLYVLCACINNANLRYFYLGSAKAVLNEVGFSFDLEQGAPDNTNGYGANPNGTYSRMVQFTGLYYTAKTSPVFGLGSGAQTRGDVMYVWTDYDGIDRWHNAHSYDVGIVEIFCDEGILGFLGLCSLIMFLILISRRGKFYKLAIFTYLISTLGTGNLYQFLVFYVIVFMNKGLEDNI